MIIIESIILCLLFTIMVYIISREPIKTLYNYPPKIQERVKSLEEYKDKIPTQENKIVVKIVASVLFLIIICLILRYINGYETFIDSFKYGFLLWTIVNLWDLIVLDIRKAAALKCGGVGIRYICRICGKEVPIFEEDGGEDFHYNACLVALGDAYLNQKNFYKF